MATQNVNLDAWFANTLGGAGNGNGNKMMVGMGTSSWAWQNRFGISIPRGTLFSGFPSASAITAFNVKLRTSSSNSGIGGSVNFYLQRGTTAFTEIQVVAGQNSVPSGANISAYVISAGATTGHWPGPTRDATTPTPGHFTGSPAADVWITVPCLEIGRWWYANSQVSNLVLVGIASDETATAQRCTFYTRESSSVPYVEIAGGTNSPPDKPTILTTSVGADGTTLTVSAKYTDPNGDTSPQYEVQYDPV